MVHADDHRIPRYAHAGRGERVSGEGQKRDILDGLARTGPNRPPRVLFEPDLGAALDVSGESEAEPVLYRVILERRKRREAAEARRVFYVAPTRARDHLILSATEGLSNKQCGLTLLAPGLDAAGATLAPVVFDEEDARPPELPLPEPAEPPRLLLGQA